MVASHVGPCKLILPAQLTQLDQATDSNKREIPVFELKEEPLSAMIMPVLEVDGVEVCIGRSEIVIVRNSVIMCTHVATR